MFDFNLIGQTRVILLSFPLLVLPRFLVVSFYHCMRRLYDPYLALIGQSYLYRHIIYILRPSGIVDWDNYDRLV